MRLNGIVDIRDFRHHCLVHSQTSGGIDNYHIKTILLGVGNGVFGYANRVVVFSFRIHFHPDLSAHHMQLVDRCGTINVTSH